MLSLTFEFISQQLEGRLFSQKLASLVIETFQLSLHYQLDLEIEVPGAFTIATCLRWSILQNMYKCNII